MRFSKRGAAAIVAVAALTLGACSSGTESANTSGSSPAAGQEQTTSQESPQVVSAEEFAKVIEQPDVVILDVRTPAEFAEGHIEGAINIDLNGPDFAGEVAKIEDKGQTYAVYCRSGSRSAVAVQEMVDAGFTSLYDLGGGIISWENAGLPLV